MNSESISCRLVRFHREGPFRDAVEAAGPHRTGPPEG